MDDPHGLAGLLQVRQGGLLSLNEREFAWLEGAPSQIEQVHAGDEPVVARRVSRYLPPRRRSGLVDAARVGDVVGLAYLEDGALGGNAGHDEVDPLGSPAFARARTRACASWVNPGRPRGEAIQATSAVSQARPLRVSTSAMAASELGAARSTSLPRLAARIEATATRARTHLCRDRCQPLATSPSRRTSPRRPADRPVLVQLEIRPTIYERSGDCIRSATARDRRVSGLHKEASNLLAWQAAEKGCERGRAAKPPSRQERNPRSWPSLRCNASSMTTGYTVRQRSWLVGTVSRETSTNTSWAPVRKEPGVKCAYTIENGPACDGREAGGCRHRARLGELDGRQPSGLREPHAAFAPAGVALHRPRDGRRSREAWRDVRRRRAQCRHRHHQHQCRGPHDEAVGGSIANGCGAWDAMVFAHVGDYLEITQEYGTKVSTPNDVQVLSP